MNNHKNTRQKQELYTQIMSQQYEYNIICTLMFGITGSQKKASCQLSGIVLMQRFH